MGAGLQVESAVQRQQRIEHVARLTERLHMIEALLSQEIDPHKRATYEDEKTIVMEALRQIRH